MPFDALLVQARPVLGDVKANAARVVDVLRRERSAELVVFPELFLSGYALRDAFATEAIAPDGPVVAELAAACRETGKHLVVGAPVRSATRGLLHNSLLYFTPRGYAGRYDKVYLPTFSLFEEDHFFQEGHALPVFDATLGGARSDSEGNDASGRVGERVRLGLCICYDLFFPEVTKTLARKGADVIVCASASPTPSRAHFESVFAARAVETTCHVLYTNLAGAQDTALFWGGAQAWSARGGMIAKAPYDEEHELRVTLDVADVAEARRRRPVLRDTRGEVLRMLLDAAPEE
jgi:predicted amidohydrolase